MKKGETKVGSCMSSKKDASLCSRRCDVEKAERVKAMPHSATLATRLGAELKARILPQRGDAALAPHKSSCFCLEQGGENRWNPPPPLPTRSFSLSPSFSLSLSTTLLLLHTYLPINLSLDLPNHLPIYPFTRSFILNYYY